MTEVRFYHLTRKPLEAALPEMLEKACSRGDKVVVRTSSASEAEALNSLLWKYDPDSFLPHGSKTDGNAEMQPVWLTDTTDNPNAAETLFIIGGADDADINAYGLVCLLFEDHDSDSVSVARERWKKYRESGLEQAYWQQTDTGWEKKQ